MGLKSLGLAREEGGLAARVLKSLGITIERVRAEVMRLSAPGDQPTMKAIPFTPAARRVLERSLDEALKLGCHKQIDTEHILLNLVHENGDPALGILLTLGANADKIRDEPIRIIRSWKE